MIDGPTILLRSGTYFNILEPEQSAFTLDDIAHGLSHVCRFAGQCERFYSVAEHSVLVSQCVPPEAAWAALLHDASEAFIGDVTRPLKALLPAYKEIEQRIEMAIFARFGVATPLPSIVKEIDRRLLRSEQLQVMQCRDGWKWTAGAALLDVTIECFPPVEAKYRFLERAGELAR